VELNTDALAKLMLAELHLPDLFGQLLSWLAAGVVGERVTELEGGQGDHSEAVRAWGQLLPTLSGEDLAKYLVLAASLRGETLEEAALPPELRDVATSLSHSSDGRRREGREAAKKLGESERLTLVRYLASTIRYQRTPETQRAYADSLSELSSTPAAAATAAEELDRMPPGDITAAVPMALLSRNQPAELVGLITRWKDSTHVPELTRRSCNEALGGQ
jgi:hypothetical protein